MSNVGHSPLGHSPVGHEPAGHHPATSSTSSSSSGGATAPGSAASTLDLYASTFQVDQISNSNTSSGVGYYEIDDRTGFKLYPYWHPLSKAKEDGYGWFTKHGDARHPQEFVKSRGNDKAIGPQFAEPDPVYISASVSPEDL